jgi:hypothetical protein
MSPAHVISTVIWDQSPDTIGGTLTSGKWLNNNSHSFADPVKFTGPVIVTGMDVYMDLLYGAIGASAAIRIRSGSHLGRLTEFVENVSIDDDDGTNSIECLHRLHVDFTNPASLMCGIEYWVGMSSASNVPTFAQAGIVGGVGPLLDNQTARYFGARFDSFSQIGDISDTAFRLWGTQIPIPRDP